MQVDYQYGDKSLKEINSQELVWKWMTPDPIVVQAKQTLRKAVYLFQDHRIDSLPVVDAEKRIIGLLTKSCLLTAFLKGFSPDSCVFDVMVRKVVTIGKNESIQKAYQMYLGSLPVVDDAGRLVGVLTRTNILHLYDDHLQRLQETQHSAETLKTILDSAYEGIAVIDEQGIITEFNEAYCRIIGIKREEAIGKHATRIIDNTRLHIVLQTGVAEKGYIQHIHGQDMVVHRIPIWKGEKVIGAIGMVIFEGVQDLHHILERMQQLSRQVSGNVAVSEQSYKLDNGIEGIIGRSAEIEAVMRMARKAARIPTTVLITGESGTGKEIFAKSIHTLSPYSGGPFISVNCAAIPEQLLEAELFGYEEGAFTGAKKGGKPGKFELAHKGTLFLDEIGDMPPLMQAKILRVLQEKEVERVGGLTKHFVDVRIVAATNRRLEEMVKEGTFREDLYYRLNIIRLQLPPLRERREDIPMLLKHHLYQFCEWYALEQKTFSVGAMTVLMDYGWPGNVRELVNTVEMLVSLSESDTIQVQDLPTKFTPNIPSHRPEKTTVSVEANTDVFTNIKNVVLEREKELIIRTLQETGGNKAAAARKLGIERSTLYEKLKKHGIVNKRPKITT